MNGMTTDQTVQNGPVNLLKAWRLHLWVFILTCVAEMIGSVSVPLGFATITIFPLVWGMLFGAAVGLVSTRVATPVSLRRPDVQAATIVIQAAVIMFVAKQSLLVGPLIPKLLSSGWALCFQEIGHFFGTVLLALPLALLLGIKREAIGSTFSVGREQNLAIIGERYGLNSPEGRGVMAEYITGTVLGALCVSIVASCIASSRLFNPLALAMASGVGSGSMMAAAAGAVAAYAPARDTTEILGFAAASNLITTTVGTYFTLLVSLPFTVFLYRVLEPRIGRFRQGAARVTPTTAGTIVQEDGPLPFSSLVLITATVSIMTLLLGNWITYDVAPWAAMTGALCIILTGLAGEGLHRLVPLRIPSVLWVTMLGMALTAPYWPGARWFAACTQHVNFLAIVTPLLTYAGISLTRDIPAFRQLGWRIVVVSLSANAGTFIFAALIAQFFI